MPPLHPATKSLRRTAALGVLACSQLLIVLDATIVNVALTSIQDDLRLSTADLQWVITGYVLAFGGFLLLGGRLADTFGRRRVFIIGALLFAAGSLMCALASSPLSLLIGRTVQGLGAAAIAPASMSLLLTVFPAGRDRNRALAVWGGVSSSGTALGLILGGVITELLSWEWVFLLATPIALLAAAAAPIMLPESAPEGPQRFDVAGAVLATAGLASLVYGLVHTAEVGWRSASTAVVLLVAALLLVCFVVLQTRRPHALIPRRLVRNQAVVGANIVGLILGSSIYALFFFMSVFMGTLADYGSVMTGLAFLPMAGAIAAGSALAGRMIERTGPFPLLVASAIVVTVGLASLARISPDSSYVSVQLPGFLLAGAGLGLAFVALTTAAVGSAPGALGLAVLTAVSTARTDALTPHGVAPTATAITGGWSLGFLVAAATMLGGLAVIVMTIHGPRPSPRTGERPSPRIASDR